MIKPDFGKKQPLILVAEDDLTMCMIMRVAMGKEGYRVAETNDGKKCFDLCQQLKPDIVLLDAMIPEIDGFTCCKKLHTILGHNCPPILIITSLDDRGLETVPSNLV